MHIFFVYIYVYLYDNIYIFAGKNSDVADIVNYLKASGGIGIDWDPQQPAGSAAFPAFCEDRGLEYTWRGAVIGGDLDRINEFLENGQDIEERTGYLIYLDSGKHFPSNDSFFG